MNVSIKVIRKEAGGYQPKWCIDWTQTCHKLYTCTRALDHISWVILVGKRCLSNFFLLLLPLPTLLSPLFGAFNETNAKSDGPDENSESRYATDPNDDEDDFELP
jgi:hypothetical protein